MSGPGFANQLSARSTTPSVTSSTDHKKSDPASSVWIGLVDRRGPALVPTQPQQQQTTVRTPSRRQRVTPGREVGPCFEIPVHALHCAEVSARGLSDATSVTMSRP